MRRTKLVPRPTSPGAVIDATVIARLYNAIDAAQQPQEMHFDAEAAERWDWFYAEMAITTRLGLAGAVTARHEAQVARLSLVYALADGADAIGSEHLEAAIAFADYARRSVVWALGDSTGDRHADVLRSMLTDGEVGWEDGKRALGLRTAAEMVEAVSVLVDAGLAEVATASSGGGRPRRVIRAGAMTYHAKHAGCLRLTTRSTQGACDLPRKARRVPARTYHAFHANHARCLRERGITSAQPFFFFLLYVQGPCVVCVVTAVSPCPPMTAPSIVAPSARSLMPARRTP